ncbi:MAG: tetratricopeptide repeat protein [Rhodopila sp.]
MPSATLPVDRSKVSTLLARAAGLRQSGALAESIPPQREAARLDPGNYRIQHDLGLACLQYGQLNEAVAAFQRCVTNNPRFAEGFWRLGLAYERMGQAAAAAAAYRQAVELRPSLSEAQYGLANLLENLGHRTEAIGIFRKAAGAARKPTLRRIATARAFLAEGNDAAAETIFRQIVYLFSV